jgi:hypothetical protein
MVLQPLQSGVVALQPLQLVHLVGALVPLLVALVTKRYAEPWVKVATNLVALALGASIVYLARDTGGYDLAGFVNAFINALVADVVAYFGALRYTAVLAIERRTADVGVGTSRPVAHRAAA